MSVRARSCVGPAYSGGKVDSFILYLYVHSSCNPFTLNSIFDETILQERATPSLGLPHARLTGKGRQGNVAPQRTDEGEYRTDEGVGLPSTDRLPL